MDTEDGQDFLLISSHLSCGTAQVCCVLRFGYPSWKFPPVTNVDKHPYIWISIVPKAFFLHHHLSSIIHFKFLFSIKINLSKLLSNVPCEGHRLLHGSEQSHKDFAFGCFIKIHGLNSHTYWHSENVPWKPFRDRWRSLDPTLKTTDLGD